MTARELLEKGKGLAELAAPRLTAAAAWAWRNRVVVLAVLVVLLAASALRSCYRADLAEGRAAAGAVREAGEARADAAGIPVVHPVPQAVVDEAGEKAKREVPELKARLERAQKELGRLRLELVARVQTDPAPAQEPVAKGEHLRLGADLVVGQAPSGAHLLEGTLDARTLDGKLVLRQPFSAPVTIAVSAPCEAASPAAQDRAWRAGGVGGVSGQGWLAGAAYTRRLDVFGYRPEVVAAAAGGTGGAVLLVGVLF
jgi:hypothetical protein